MHRPRSQLGRVVEDGRTIGLVALEDVLEQLIGDVRSADVVAPPTTRARRTAQAGAGAGGR